MSTPAPLIVRALRGEAVERVPIWMMRQAGRVLPEYRALKAEHGFLGMVRDPDLAVEVTLQPLRRWAVDGAILFSDIMTPLVGMGVDIEFAPGPRIANPVRTRADVDALGDLDPERDVPYVAETLRRLRAAVPPGTAVLGFAGSPFTVAHYLVDEGTAKGEARSLRGLLHRDPDTFRALLDRLADATTVYLRAQIEAGADAVQVFDTWGGWLSAAQFREFHAPALRRILDGLKDTGVPVIHYAGGAVHLFAEAAALGFDALSVDHRLPLDEVRARIPAGVGLQGNLDPSTLLGDAAGIRNGARDVLRAGGGRGHVFNLGHGLWPEITPEAVDTLVATVREHGERAAAGEMDA